MPYLRSVAVPIEATLDPTITTLISFDGSTTAPGGGFIMDAAGNLISEAAGNDFQVGLPDGNVGDIFEIAKTASGYAGTPEVLVKFNSTDGANPIGLIADAAGNLFGSTSQGGTHGFGTIFEVMKTASGYSGTPTTLVNLVYGDGFTSLEMIDSTGDLLGVAGLSTFELTKTASGYASTLIALPEANFEISTADRAGNLFGISGGTDGHGTIVELARTANGYAGALTALANVPANFEGRLTTDAAGDLFGATSDGVVFELAKTASGYATTPTTLATADGVPGSLIVDSAGDLFAIANYAAEAGDGTVFEIAKSGNGYASMPIVLGHFNGADGAQPSGSLIADVAGNLFGMTTTGGANGGGTAFELSGAGFQVATSGPFRPVIGGTVAGQAIGDQPTCLPFSTVVIADANPGQTESVTVTLSAAANGTLSNLGGGTYNAATGVYTVFGTAAAVMAAVDGVEFTPTAHQVPPGETVITTFTIADRDSAGVTATDSTTTVAAVSGFALSTLANFAISANQTPEGLIADAAGDLFGATSGGGSNSYGKIFELARTASGYASTPSILAGFDGINGTNPLGNLLADTAGNLFGTTVGGTVFELPKVADGYAGAPITLASLGANDLNAGLVADNSGNLFGTTISGTVFELAKIASGYAGTPATLATLGGSIRGGLLVDAAGNLLGTTSNGGANGDGAVFEIAKTASGYASTATTLASFNFPGTSGSGTGLGGAGPAASLVADTAGNLFGTTYAGGSSDLGTVFEIVKTASGYANTPTILASFDGTDGANPVAGLIVDAAGDLFGATLGFVSGRGAVFEIVKTTSGYASTPSLLIDGAHPFSNLISDAGGGLFGTTGLDPSSDGTVFQLTNSGFKISVTDALSTFSANQAPRSLLIGDTASNVSANLGGLQSVVAAGDLGSITLTDGNVPTVSVTAAQLTNDAAVLHDIASPYALSINASVPNVTITGINAQDTVVFSGTTSEYTIAVAAVGSPYTVTDTGTGRTSVDHISGIEFLQFADRMLFVATPAEAQIALLYQAALGRAPDAPGLVGWQNAFATESASAQGADHFTALAGTPVSGLPDLAYGFTTSAEFQAKYGSLTDSQFVTQLYANVLDRAPDAAGFNGWVNALAQGHTREWVLVGFAESPEAYHNAEVGYVGQIGTVHAPWLVVT